MKLIYTFFICFLLSSVSAQTNVELLSQIDYDATGNDVWGYIAPNGDEYAIMGLDDGVSVVNITDPRNPVEIDYIDQTRTIWRDIKTWGEYAYVTSESRGNGLLAINMSYLPDSITYENLFLDVPATNTNLPDETINSCHNIFIDELGFAYLAGCDVNRGGVEIFDLKQTPGLPVYVGATNETYSHDVFARDNKMYNSEINIGEFAIYDVSDKSNIIKLGSSETPFSTTHNTWLSDNSEVLFTTDERRNAPVASYNVSDPTDIKKLDEFRPLLTVGDGVIPHNVHVWSDWLIISYYTDGCVIVDAARPDNMIEVGNWDSFLSGALGDGFNGAWGAFPWFPSGTIILGDQQTGLLVLGPTYKRASYLEGTVTDSRTGDPLVNAEVVIEELSLSGFSKANGEYKTGTVQEGTFTVTASRDGYFPQTRSVEMKNGVLSLEDFALEYKPVINLSGSVVDAETGEKLSQAIVSLYDGMQTFNFVTDENGSFGSYAGFAGDFEVIAGSWGHKYKVLDDLFYDGTDLEPNLVIELEKGYEDIFSLDLGWTTDIEGSQGLWVRVIPIGYEPPNLPAFVSPDGDSDDIGNRAYVTGQSNTFQAGILRGSTSLVSPLFDGSTYENPVMTFDYYLWTTDVNLGLNMYPLQISVSNGTDTVLIAEQLMVDLPTGLEWQPSMQLQLKDHIELSEEMQVTVSISSESIVDITEAGFDNFKIFEEGSVAIQELIDNQEFIAYPNPSNSGFNIKIPSDYQNDKSILSLYDQKGMRMAYHKLGADSPLITIGNEIQSGVYFLQLMNDKRKTQSVKIVKI